MAMMRWDPFGEMLSMQRDMDRITSRMGGKGGMTDFTWMPRTDVVRQGDDIVMHVELPGMKQEDVDIEVTDDVLTVHGERKMEEDRQEKDYMLHERAYGRFERSMVLPQGVDASQIRAEFRDGVLDVTIPKGIEAMKPQTTKVQIMGGTGQPAMEGGQMAATAEPGAYTGGKPDTGGEQAA